MKRKLTRNIENFYSKNGRVAGLLIKLNNKYKIKIVQVYAPTSAYADEDVERCNEDVYMGKICHAQKR